MSIKSLLPNLKVRIAKLQSGYLQLRYYENGKEVRKSYHLKYNDENVKLMKSTQIPLIQQYLAQNKPTRVIGRDSLKDYIKEVMNESKQTKSQNTYQTYIVYQKQIDQFFEQKYPKEYNLSVTVIQTHHLESFVKFLHSKGKSKATIDLAMVPIRLAFQKAVKNHGLGLLDILAKIDYKIMDDAIETKAFSIDEVKTIIVNANGDLKATIALCFFLGLRIGEAYGLKWSDIDFEKKIITVQRQRKTIKGVDKILKTTKGKKTRVVPLYPVLENFLMSIRDNSNEYIISNADLCTHTKQLREVLKANSIPDQERRLFHRFRHTSGSVAEASGESKTFVQKTLGHQNAQTTEGYLHIIDGMGDGSKVNQFFSKNFII